MNLTESIVENAALTWFGALGCTVGHGPQLAPGEHARGTLTPALSQGEREEDGEVVLVGRLREAIRRLKPAITFHTLAVPGGTLLPKLLSGELSVGEINNEEEAAI